MFQLLWTQLFSLSLTVFSRYSAWSSCVRFWPTAYSWHSVIPRSGPSKWSKSTSILLLSSHILIWCSPHLFCPLLFLSLKGIPLQVSIRLSHSQKLLPEVLPSTGSPFSETLGTGWTSWSFLWRKYFRTHWFVINKNTTPPIWKIKLGSLKTAQINMRCLSCLLQSWLRIYLYLKFIFYRS